MPVDVLAPRPGARWLQVELVAVGWETFSALLFVSAVLPVAFASPWPAVVFVASLGFSALCARSLIGRGAPGFAVAGAIRIVAWPLAIAPLLDVTGPGGLVTAVAFGVMAGGIRRAVYHRGTEAPEAPIDDRALGRALRPRLAESAMVAGIVGGHVMLLFTVTFLRTRSPVLFEAWLRYLPPVAILATLVFTLAVRPATERILRALEAGEHGDAELLRAGLRQANQLPAVLAYVNFALWLLCTTAGVFWFRTGPKRFLPGDALMQLGLCFLFALGVSLYQRAWHKDAVVELSARLRRWTGAAPAIEPSTLRRRMLIDFGTPLLFTASLSLLASIGLYRALGSELPSREDFNAVSALFASFAVLVLAAGGVVARAARELSRPMIEIARAADRVVSGDLDAAVPPVLGPVEIVGLGASIERMRESLARTIAELEEERAGLEANVETRTAELRRALDELKRAQAALVHGERLASIGELVAGVAHEIHNPLNAIAGAAAPLERVAHELRAMIDAYREAEAELPPARRHALAAKRAELDLDASLDDLAGISNVVRRGIDRSVRIVQNLKSFSSVAGEALPTDLHAGLDETLLLLGPRLRQSGIRLDKRYGELPLVVCRGGEINQVFMNLLTNAIHAIEGKGGPAEATRDSSPGDVVRDAMPPRPSPTEGTGALRAEGALIAIRSWVDDGFAAIAISDSGPGVPPAIEARIFDPFFTTKRRGEGTGLGLSISTDIARRHGGTLTLEPAPGERGACFVCRLPLASPAGGGRGLRDRRSAPELAS